ncbi:Rieske (2Fe-2S) protein [Nitrospira sp. Nam74]
MKRNTDQLIAQLKAQGLYFSSFSLEHEGTYAAADAEWNYKDIPHLHCVHELVEAIISHASTHEIATINIQKVLGLKVPMAVFNYSFDERTQIYYTTFLFFALIVETTYDSLSENQARVVTRYSIGTPRALQFLFPLITWVIKRNYKNLMSTDIPMRQRRGQLRSWGYTFLRPPDGYGFEQTMNLSCANVILPKEASSFPPVQLKIEADQGLQNEWLIGRDDHLGLRLVRQDKKLCVFARMCPHEGASLDPHPCVRGRLTCPWHGRVFPPIAQFNLLCSDIQRVLTDFHEMSLEKNVLSISIKEVVKA